MVDGAHKPEAQPEVLSWLSLGQDAADRMAQQNDKRESGVTPESSQAPLRQDGGQAAGPAPGSAPGSAPGPTPGQEGGLVAEPNRWLMNLNLSYEDMLRSAVDWLWETNAQLGFTQVAALHDDVKLPAGLQTGGGLVDLYEPAEAAVDGPSLAELLAAREAFRHVTVLIGEPDDEELRRGQRYRLSGVPLYDRRNGQFLGYRGTGALAGAPESVEMGAAQPESVEPQSAEPESPEPAPDEPDNRLLSLLEQALSRKDQLEWELSKAGHKTFEARLESIAHELRTPLNAIIGFAEIIKTRALGNDLERYVNYGNDIYDSGVHMVALVNNLIDLARIDSRQDPLQHELLDARQVVASALRMLEEQAADKGIKLVNHLTQELPALRSERQALRQIFLNLLSNGIKYTRSGGAVGVESEISREGVVSIVVWDTGIGIPLEEQEKVFQRTYRVKGAANAGKPGSGLGLAISRDLARAMGGDITVLSRPGQGARFTVRLPAAGDSNAMYDSNAT